MPDQPNQIVACNPRIDALDCGVWLNRFRFHMSQAWFFANRWYLEEAKRAAEQLGITSRGLFKNPAEKQNIQLFIQSKTSNLLGTADALWHAEDLLKFNDSLEYNSDVDPKWERARFLIPVFEEISEIQRYFQNVCNEEELLAFYFGEHLDQGVRPANVYEHFDRVNPNWNVEAIQQESKYVQSEPGRFGGVGGGGHLEPFFVNKSVQPGEIPPRETWL